MYLRQLDIAGFRGIKRLSVRLGSNMVLIGENSWGKSSLLSALQVIFNPEGKLYRFNTKDFHLSAEKQEIMLLFTFESREEEKNHGLLTRQLSEALFPYEEGSRRLYLRVFGEKKPQGEIHTRYSFLDQQGGELNIARAETLIQALLKQHPVYRLRDARLNVPPLCNLPLPREKNERDELSAEFYAVSELLKYYFIERLDPTALSQDPALLWNRLQSLCYKLAQDESKQLQQRLKHSLFSLFMHENIASDKAHNVRPILLLEDLENRLHPRMVAMVWELLNYLPVQRILTTNSVELISRADLTTVCRLVRYPDRTRAYRLSRHELSKEDFRRLSFHIHHNRSLALFSRMWILVEGETEVWILSELANLLGINLATEGIRIVEFAQCGLRPLLKYAQAMGIEWYVLTDGDESGHKYAAIAKDMIGANEHPHQRLTLLPKTDIEHFFYSQGFSDVFIRLAQWKPGGNYPVNKIIQRAIQRTSKPDLAILLSNEIEKRGKDSIPLLFKRLFSKVLNLARTQDI
ncbi:putative ATP-dependent endonuclease of OLD family [Mesocricetibacter intestinalis]|uniref:Putative ATP-dependent endonuclease of OLD family n=1 Tax=Mesocricetibacter intestinalis TaxID=1521930 RepID=A0A4R6VBB6_9PAST|nr:ATP-dependent endonuclease [Mesocricetibacter intestinalis]TDQ57431.1 putative ATP-dependent endonuclease of OLD family [Mesocricetibacter intestinalis]